MAGGAAPSRLLLGGKRVDLGQTIDPAVIGCNGDPGVLWGGHWGGVGCSECSSGGRHGGGVVPLILGQKEGKWGRVGVVGFTFLMGEKQVEWGKNSKRMG